MTTAELLSRRIENNRKHQALAQKRRRLLAKANRMHPVTARPLYAQAEAMVAEMERLLKG